MSPFKRAGFLIFPIAWILLCVQPAAGMDAQDAPADVTIDYLQELYTAVSFDHQLHSDMYDCSLCHHHTAGTGTQTKACQKCHTTSDASDDVSCSGCHKYEKSGASIGKNHTTDASFYHIDKPGLKGALHLQCLGCHRAENGPTDCQGCHSFTAAGRKRFALKN
jgi:hypothetical protein